MNDKSRQRIFFFTGLGADERAFAHLKLKTDLPQVHVAWLPPEKEESLTGYCQRLAKTYGIKDGDLLIGLSFGGLVATEISMKIKTSFTVLISSAATRQELPLLYRIAGKTGLDRLIPKKLLKSPEKLKYFLFGLHKPEQRQLFDEIVRQADVEFVRWALRKVVTWDNRVRPENLIKIHGTADKIMPIHRRSTDFVLSGGSHFLTWEKAKEVSTILNHLLEK